MLVLTRKTQEQIHIGENITVTVLRIKGNTVRIGIEAPREVRVVRGELPPVAQPSPAVQELTIELDDSDAGNRPLAGDVADTGSRKALLAVKPSLQGYVDQVMSAHAV